MQKGRISLKTEKQSLFPDNTTGLVTPAKVRQMVDDLIDSTPNIEDAYYGDAEQNTFLAGPSSSFGASFFRPITLADLPVGFSGYTTLFDHYASVQSPGNGSENDLYSDTISAGKLAANGDKICASYGFTNSGSGATNIRVRLYFGGSNFYDSGNQSNGGAGNLVIDVTIIRVSSTVVRYRIKGQGAGIGLTSISGNGEITGLTLSGTNVLKNTVQLSSGSPTLGDLTAYTGYVEYKPHA